MRRTATAGLVALALTCAPPVAAPVAPQPYDLVIANGRVVDGSGRPAYTADVAIAHGTIATIGKLAGAPRARTIDAAGMVVAPGFIDMLGRSEVTILVDPRLPSKIFQGITTEVTGEGVSPAPLDAAMIAKDRAGYEHLGVTPDWRTMGEYFARLERQHIGINLASYVGATSVRRVVLGDEDRAPTPAELERMKSLVREAMRDGAVGLSTSLMYPPAPYAKTEELVALAREAAPFGAIYATHLRNESDAVLEAVDEAVRIGREAHVSVEIFHLKTAGKRNWGRMPELVAKIEAARRQGVDVAADTYAYTAWFNALSAFVPPWAHDGGDEKLVLRLKDPETRARIRKDLETPSKSWDNEWQSIPGPRAVMIGAVEDARLVPLQGKTLEDVAALWKKDPMDALFDLLVQDNAHTGAAVFALAEPDVALALAQAWTTIGCDYSGVAPDGILGQEHPHPRAYGTFPHVLRKYVREEHLLTLEQAIHRFSGLAAARMRFADRGLLRAGMAADVVVFDPARIVDRATFERPNQLAEGMRFVLVNGVPVLDEGKMTGALPGKVLRR